MAAQRRARGRDVLGTLIALWVVVTLGFVVLLASEYTATGSRFGGCEIMDSTYGEHHWQWFPPGTYCTAGKGQAELAQEGVKLPDWHRPGERRGAAVVVLAVTGGLLATVIVARRRAERPAEAIPVEISL